VCRGRIKKVPDLTAFSAGFALSAALIIAIGSQNAFVLRQGLRREHVGPLVAFCAVADLLLIAAGVAGLGAVLDRVPGLASALTLGGAAFLTWYGLTALRRALHPAALLAEGGDQALSLKAALLRCAAFTLLNPHVYLDTVLVVGAIGASQADDGQVWFVFGAGLASALWFAALGYGARLLAPMFAKPGAWRVLDLLIGGTMLVIAGGLLWSIA
jgi:L-lysine exporter family protein LysE/ArgO